MSTSPRVRERDVNDEHDPTPSAKRVKLDEVPEVTMVTETEPAQSSSSLPSDNQKAQAKTESLLPPSHVLLGTASPATSEDGTMLRIMETDVGISEYIAKDVPKIEGIIKQRCVSASSYLHGVLH